MYIVDMIDSWDRTVRSWVVDYSEEEVKQFVENLNNGKTDELSLYVKSNESFWFTYYKMDIEPLPSDTELMEIMKPSEWELQRRETESSSGLSYDMIKDWEVVIPDFTEMFKNCK